MCARSNCKLVIRPNSKLISRFSKRSTYSLEEATPTSWTRLQRYLARILSMITSKNMVLVWILKNSRTSNRKIFLIKRRKRVSWNLLVNEENEHLCEQKAIDLLDKLLVYDHVDIYWPRPRDWLPNRQWCTPTLKKLENMLNNINIFIFYLIITILYNFF